MEKILKSFPFHARSMPCCAVWGKFQKVFHFTLDPCPAALCGENFKKEEEEEKEEDENRRRRRGRRRRRKRRRRRRRK